jgi:hypothetical protein
LVSWKQVLLADLKALLKTKSTKTAIATVFFILSKNNKQNSKPALNKNFNFSKMTCAVGEAIP